MSSLIIDTDCGIDDVTSLIMALKTPAANVLCITTVAGTSLPALTATINTGNVSVEAATRGTRTVIGLCGGPCPPVFQGAAAPLIHGYHPAVPSWPGHGKDGFGGAISQFAHYADSVPDVDVSVHAAVKLVQIVRSQAEGSVSICALGPLTNIAIAVSLDPQFLGRLKHLWIMVYTIFVFILSVCL